MPKGSDAREAGNGVLEQSEAFGDQFRAKKGIPCNIPAWSGEADDQFITNRIGHATHDDRDYAGCLFGCASWRRTYHDDDVNLEPNQISRELRESICIPIPVASLDRYVQTLGVTELAQPVVKSNGPGVSVEPGFNTPIRGSFPFCWALAASGHAAAAPPNSLMNSRRFIANPKLGRWHLSGSNRHVDRG
jgi:hypothetical protein